MWIHGILASSPRPLSLEPEIRVDRMSPGPYRLAQDWIGTVEIEFCGEPSITRSL